MFLQILIYTALADTVHMYKYIQNSVFQSAPVAVTVFFVQ